MKKLTILVATMIALASCHSRDNGYAISQKEHPSSAIEFTNYVDSLGNVNHTEFSEEHLALIRQACDSKMSKAESGNLSDDEKRQLKEAKAKYEDIVNRYHAELEKNRELQAKNK